MDTITITDLVLETRMGVPEEERRSPQKVLMTVVLHLRLEDAGRHDDVRRTVDYDAVCRDLRALAGTERKTIERLAEDAATMILRRYQPESVDVTVTKFPPIGAASVQCTIRRS